MENKLTQVVWVDPKTLTPHPKNPNRHSEDQIKRIVKIIQENGWRHPIIVSTLSNKIIVGHGRLEAAKLMGASKGARDVPGV